MSENTPVSTTAIDSFVPDLPSRFFKHTLELVSFGGETSRMSLALVYYSRPTRDPSAPSLYNSNLFRFAPGIKLNIQKRLIIEENDIYLVDNDGSLVRFCGSSVMMAQDSSGRELSRNSDGSYILILANGMYEIYHANGTLWKVWQKNNTGTDSYLLLDYTYSTIEGAEVLTHIIDRLSRKITLSYAMAGGALLVSGISLSDASDTIKWEATFHYNVTVGSPISHLRVNNKNANIIYRFQSTKTSVMTKPASDSTWDETGYIALSEYQIASDSKSSTVKNVCQDRTVSETTYRYLIPQGDNPLFNALVEAEDRNGVVSRTQYDEENKAEYTYECSPGVLSGEDYLFDDANFAESTFPGFVKLLTNAALGVLPPAVGYQFSPLSTEPFFKYTGVPLAAGDNCFLFTGWIRHGGDALNSVQLNISLSGDATSQRSRFFELCGNHWFFFSQIYRVDSATDRCATVHVTISDITSQLSPYLRDVRLIPINKDIVFNQFYLHSITSDESVPERVFLDDIGTVKAIRGGQEIEFRPSGLTHVDLAQYYLRKAMRNDNSNCCFYQNHLREVQSGLTDVRIAVLGEEEECSLDLFEIGCDRFSEDMVVHCYTRCRVPIEGDQILHNYLTQNKNDITGNGSRKIYYQEYDYNGNLIFSGTISEGTSSEEEQIGTHYLRNYFGSVTQECLTTGNYLIRQYATYSVDGDRLLQTTDASGNIKCYQTDPFWGTVTETTLPSGESVCADYDLYASAPLQFTTQKDGESTTNHIIYDATGTVIGTTQDDLCYQYEYTADRLSKISTGTTTASSRIRQYEYAEDSGCNTETTCFPPFNTDSRSYVKYDKYGRPVEYGTGTAADLIFRYASYPIAGTVDDYAVNADSFLLSVTDLKADTKSTYEYAAINGPVTAIVTKSTAAGGGELHRENFTYDQKQRMTGHEFCQSGTGGLTHLTQLTYVTGENMPDADGQISTVKATVNGTVVYDAGLQYDALKRVSCIAGDIGACTVNTAIGYPAEEFSDHGYTYILTNHIPSLITQTVTPDQTQSGTLLHRYLPAFACERLAHYADTVRAASGHIGYTYDSFGRLAREDDPYRNTTQTYHYDAYGNLTSVKKYSHSTEDLPDTPLSQETFVYGNADRPDRLTAYQGKTLTYDSSGRMTGYDGKRFSWSNERLTGFSSGSLKNGTSSTTYTYDSKGQVAKKAYIYLPGKAIPLRYLSERNTVYTYDETGRLLCEKTESVFKQDTVSTTETNRITWFYGENGIAGCLFRHNSEAAVPFYFIRDFFGNVTEILNASGNTVAAYTYDAWGNCTVTRNAANDPYDFADLNPIRYRSYYYDADLACYRCGVRCYNPLWRRWISPDSPDYLDYTSANGLNLYLYCGNDPVNKYDPSGRFALSTILLISVGVGFAIGVSTSIVSQGISLGWSEINWWRVCLDGFLGGLNGAFAMSGLNCWGMGAIGATLGFFGGLAGAMINGDNLNDKNTWKEIAISTVIGGLAGLLGRSGARNADSLNKLAMYKPTDAMLKARATYDKVLTKIAMNAYKNRAGAAGALHWARSALIPAWEAMTHQHIVQSLTKSLLISGSISFIGTVGAAFFS